MRNDAAQSGTHGQSIRGPILAALLFVAVLLAVASAEGRSAGGASDAQIEGALFLVSGTRLLIVDIESRLLIREHALEAEPAGLTPTPGGVTAFVHYSVGGRVDAFSSLDYRFQRSNDLPLAGIDHLSFSPDGSRVYLGGRTGNGETVLADASHRLLEFGEIRTVASQGHGGPVIAGSRGRQLYRGATGGVEIRSYLDLSPLDGTAYIEGAEDHAIRSISFTPDFDRMLAVGETPTGEKTAFLVNPGSMDVVKTFEVNYFGDGQALHRDGMFYLLSDGGREVTAIPDSRRGSPRRNPIGIDADFLVDGHGAGILAIASYGAIVGIDDSGIGRVSRIADALGRDITGISHAVTAVKQGDAGFACF